VIYHCPGEALEGSGASWSEGELRPFGAIALSPAAAVLSYGLGIFEGLKAQRAPDGRVLLFRPGGEGVSVLPAPDGGWFGPRGVAVASDGAIAVTDTGNKRVVLYEPGRGTDFSIRLLGGGGDEPGRFSEPVGVAWLDSERLVVCDTGNHRVQILDRSGAVVELIDIDGAWQDFYSRPQVAVLDGGRILVSDTPSESLWLIDGDEVRRLELGEDGIIPTGLAAGSGVLYIGDKNGRVWIFDAP